MSLRRLSFQPPAAGAYTPAGSMNNWISLLAPTEARNTDGSFQPPTVFATLWASVRAITAREVDKAQQISQEVTHLITIPYLPGVTESMQVSFDNRTFQIEAIEDPDERKVELRMYCMERGQNAGQS